MPIGTINHSPPEAKRKLCVFCKAESETYPRCEGCGKLLALKLSSPYSIVCPRCKLIRSTGPQTQPSFEPLGGVRGLFSVKGENTMRPDELRKFQKKFIKEAFRPEIDTAVLSVPRGNGKTALAGHILSRCLTIGDPLCQPGSEYLLCAASIEQARLCFRFIRQDIEPRGGYRFIDSATRIGITHLETQTRLRVLSSNGKTSMGIVGCPVLVADESGSWETVGGGLMADAIFTAQGKPGSQMKVIFIGTLAPATSGWWHELVNDGSYGSTYVQALTGDRTKWDYWPEIRRCNPLTAISQVFCRKLREERDAAHRDSRLRARFLSYRMNVPIRR